MKQNSQDALSVRVKRFVISFFCTYIAGHKVTDYDSGHEICGRCGAHGYYNFDKYEKVALFEIPQWLYWKIAIHVHSLIYRLKHKDEDELPF